MRNRSPGTILCSEPRPSVAVFVSTRASHNAPSQGMSGGAWIGPTVEDTIRSLKAKGHNGVFLHPIGFLCDHVEVLYDIDIAFRQFAEKEGMRLWRAESLNGSKTLTAALADVVNRRMKAAGF